MNTMKAISQTQIGYSKPANTGFYSPKSRNRSNPRTVPHKDFLIDLAKRIVIAICNKCSLLSQPLNAHQWFRQLSMELGNVLERLNSSPLSTQSKIERLLRNLQKLLTFKDPSRDRPGSGYLVPYPRLALVLDGDWSNALGCIERLTLNSSCTERSEFIKTFRNFSNVKRTQRDSQSLDETRSFTEPVSHNPSQCLQELYSTLCQVSRCGNDRNDNGGDFKASIALNSISKSTGAKEGVMINLFFLHRHYSAQSEWKEAKIRAFIELENKETIQNSKITRFETGNKIVDLCGLVRSQALGFLKLSASINGLFDEGHSALGESKIFHAAPSVPLKVLLEAGALTTEVHRSHLSVLLSKAVWEFYESDWMSTHWTSDTVHFMQRYTDKQGYLSLHHQPYLIAELKACREEGVECDPRRQTHLFPRVLALGIMLLEIQLGKILADLSPANFCDSTGQKRPNAGHTTALNIIKSKEWEGDKTILRRVKEVILTCVLPDTKKLGSDPNLVRERLRTSVVEPLREMFAVMYECPDNRPEAFTPGNDDTMKIPPPDGHCNTIPELCGSEMPVSTQGPSQIAKPNMIHVEQEDSTCTLTMEKEQNIDVTTLEAESESSQLVAKKEKDIKDRKTKIWMDEFKSLHKKYRIGLMSSATRIKIAILDTGIDMQHPQLNIEHSKINHNARIKGFGSFSGGDATVDTHGHGTHIAGILLNLTNNTDLYIWKFTDSRTSKKLEEDQSRARIVEGLRHAREVWKVDMINLSFGYNKFGNPDHIQKEIERCLSANIAIFASASNDGGNGPRTYPGNYDGVICIHSADSDGKASPFSPTAAKPCEKEDNFMTVGECVESYWPLTANPPLAERYMSGTSFATPIAISIAVFMVGYIKKHMSKFDFNVPPLSPRGIRTILKYLSDEKDDYDWLSLQLFFMRYSLPKIEADLVQLLRGYEKKSEVGKA